MTEQRATQQSMNTTGYNTESVLAMRLDTTKMLAQIEAFYRGTRIIGYQENTTGQVVPVFDEFGKPRLNEIGIQQMMSHWQTLINSQTVQGNLSNDEYIEFLIRLRGDLAQDLMNNFYEYGVKEKDFDALVDMAINTAQPFFSRLIDNKERESYANTMQSIERIGESGGFLSNLNPFGRKGGK